MRIVSSAWPDFADTPQGIMYTDILCYFFFLTIMHTFLFKIQYTKLAQAL